MSHATLLPSPSPQPLWKTILAGLSASLVGIGLARFAYTPLIPPLIQAHWFAASDVIMLGAANLAGYLAGAVAGRPLAARLSTRGTLRAAMLVAVLAFAACAFPLSVGWFFAWRFASGVAGGAIMVLVAAVLLPHVPAERKGIASGAIFLGLGLGIAGSGTVVPLLLASGLRATWLGLAVISALFTAASWFAWPEDASGTVPAAATRGSAPASSAPVRLLYGQYALIAVGVVPAMVFLVDYVARGLGAGTHVGALFWILYGVGAIAGPPLYGLLADRLGPRSALRLALLVQAVAMAGLWCLHELAALAAVAVVAGSFPSGIVPLVLSCVHAAIPGDAPRQNEAWSRATTIYAASQAASGYAYSALFNQSHGDHRLLFLVAAAGLAIAVAADLALAAPRSAASALAPRC